MTITQTTGRGKVIAFARNFRAKLSASLISIGSEMSKRFLQTRKVTLFEPKKGVKFLTRNIYEKFIIFETWFHNPYTKNFYEIKEDDIVVDVGGHLGSFAIFVSQKARKGQIIVYEPAKDNFDTLVKNIDLNNAANVIIHNKAVTHQNGEIEFYSSDTITSSGSLFENGVSSKKTKVRSVMLQDIFKQNKIDRIDFLKIDVEGAEYDMLLSSDKRILSRVKCLALEYHDFIERGTFRQIVNHLRKFNFRVEVKRNLFDRFFRRGHIRAINTEWS